MLYVTHYIVTALHLRLLALPVAMMITLQFIFDVSVVNEESMDKPTEIVGYTKSKILVGLRQLTNGKKIQAWNEIVEN